MNQYKNDGIIYNDFMLCGHDVNRDDTLAVNGSYCCSPPNEELYSDEEAHGCLDRENDNFINFTLNCADNFVHILQNFPVRIRSNGNLLILLDDVSEWTTVAAGEFCLGYQIVNESMQHVSAVALCMDESHSPVVSIDYPISLHGYAVAASAVFLALTALVYLALPELRDLQGLSIISFCSTLATANVLLCVLKIVEYSDMTWCAVKGFFAYFFLISSFFWMNAIAIQILLIMKQSSSILNAGWRGFLWYALYAWGTPALFTVILVIVNYHPGHHMKPGIGHQHCWFLDLQRSWIFMYSVMSILMAANVCIFIYTSIYLWKHTFSSDHIRALKYKFSMTLRLFVIMGLPWILEMITSLTKPHIIVAILDVCNCLQGVIIFLILVVFRRRVIKALHKRNALCCLNNLAERYLAIAADDEDDIVTHTIAAPCTCKKSDLPVGALVKQCSGCQGFVYYPRIYLN